ncbi:MAG: DUF5615 family PIN-like protein [Caldilineaceae bacterium]|nr:DUF5615 family PIN-like protein [Caldilineaceae bacterium]
MKFLLDMGLAQSTVYFLRSQGYDAVHLREQGLQRLPDESIVAKAIDEERVILTHDPSCACAYSPCFGAQELK